MKDTITRERIEAYVWIGGIITVIAIAIITLPFLSEMHDRYEAFGIVVLFIGIGIVVYGAVRYLKASDADH